MVVVVGGWSNNRMTNFIETYDARADLWQLFEPCDERAKAYHGCVFMNNSMYIIGGCGIKVNLGNTENMTVFQIV